MSGATSEIGGGGGMTCTPPYIEYTDAAGVMGMRMPVNTDGTVCGVGTVGTYMGCGGTIIGDGRYCGYWPPYARRSESKRFFPMSSGRAARAAATARRRDDDRRPTRRDAPCASIDGI